MDISDTKRKNFVSHGINTPHQEIRWNYGIFRSDSLKG